MRITLFPENRIKRECQKHINWPRKWAFVYVENNHRLYKWCGFTYKVVRNRYNMCSVSYAHGRNTPTKFYAVLIFYLLLFFLF